MTGRCSTALALFLLAGAPAMAQTPAPEHTIVSLPAENFGFLPFYVAQDRKIFAEQGLDVQKVVLAGVATTNGVISGAADFGFSNGASLTRAAARGQKLLGIAIMTDKPVWAIMMSKKLADAAHFDQSGKRGGGPHQQAPAGGQQMHPIVAHESGKRQKPRTCRLDERQRKPRLAGA